MRKMPSPIFEAQAQESEGLQELLIPGAALTRYRHKRISKQFFMPKRKRNGVDLLLPYRNLEKKLRIATIFRLNTLPLSSRPLTALVWNRLSDSNLILSTHLPSLFWSENHT